MKIADVIKDAFVNTQRNRARTNLTVVAVFIGAFTLTLTNSIGTGVSSYIDAQLGQLGQGNTISVSKPLDSDVAPTTGPQKYEKTSISQQENLVSQGAAGAGFAMGPLTQEDLDEIAQIDNVKYVEPTILAQPDYVSGVNGEQYVAQANITASVMTPDLTAGEPFTDNTKDFEVIIPQSYVEPLGFDNDADAVNEPIIIGVSDVLGGEHEIEAVIVGVNNKSLFGETVSFNNAVTAEISAVQKEGLPEEQKKPVYISGLVFVDETITSEQIEQIKTDLQDAGYEGQTIQDQLGSIQAVIDGIIGVLNAFGIIALIAAGFGIVNTLLMSVQERTREIGLMKAMGMPNGKIYTLFSAEAILIGIIGTAIGVVSAIGVGTGINLMLKDTLLADLPGLTLSLFTVPDVLTVFVIVMAISFLAGTIPATKASKQNPIDALRYE